MSASQTPEPGTERILRSTTRNPRRRQRQSDNDGTPPVQAPKRRRRNDIKDDTFRPRDSTENVPPAESESVPEGPETINVTSNGHLRHHQHDSNMRNGYGSHREAPMTIRSKPKRLRGDGATTLAQNQCYSVKLLPSTPKELRKEGVQYRGSLNGEHALAITHEKAIIWEYNAHVTATNLRTFDTPFSSKADAPLPFGALIPNGSSTQDLGLLLVSATTGEAVFYESIDRAASVGLFQDRNTGVRGLVGSLFSGETVVDLVSAEHAGFVVVLSSGRIAQLTLRDAQGKPKISGQFMRVTETSSGLLGSFGRLWSGGFRKDLSAVHTRPLAVRGQMQAVGLTEKAEILIWDLDWAGRSDFKSSIEFWDILMVELKDLQIPEMIGKIHNTCALDFAILDRPSTVPHNAVATMATEQPLALLILLRVGSQDMHTYALAEVVIHGDAVDVSRIFQLSTYQSQGNIQFQTRPLLVLPKPGHTAFVAFEDATLMVSTREPETPEAQFHTNDQSIIESQPELYEETIYLRGGKHLAFQDMREEISRSNASNVVAFVKSSGLIRISAADAHDLPDALPNAKGVKISPKSKIEQAVFYGALQTDNIIDFSRRTQSRFKDSDIEDAALEISYEIFRAETSFTNLISPSPTSMEQHLAMKSKALKALASFVRQNYPVLSPHVMWRLLWDAERVAVGRQLWIAFEEHIAMSMDNGKRKGTLLDELCVWFIDRKFEFTKREDLKEEDAVRKFFIGGLNCLENLLDYVRILLHDLKEDKDKSAVTLLRLVYQANDIWLRSLDTTFNFRSDNCSEYGILPESIEDGILVDSAEYVDVPEFWTSTKALITGTIDVATLSRHFASRYFENGVIPGTEDYVRDLAVTNPQLVTLYCLQAREGIRWKASRHAPKDQEEARELEHNFAELRYQLCRQLADVGQSEPGMKLAEKHRDMHTLTDMVIAEEQYLVEELQKPNNKERDIIISLREQLEAKVQAYFERFGTKWADEFFNKLFSGTTIGDRLEQAQSQWRDALTTYLRADPKRAKICWINDITANNDFKNASEVLVRNAEHEEDRLWAKKVELSMSKLAMMAANESNGLAVAKKLSSVPAGTRISPTNDLTLVTIQEDVTRHFYQDAISAIDQEAAVEVIIKKYGRHTTEYPALRQLLEHSLSLLLNYTVLSLEQVIDVLTLIDIHDSPDDPDNLQRSEFFKAIVALDSGGAMNHANRNEMLLQLIWKRCYIYDDWAELQLSKKKSDTERKQGMRQTAVWAMLYQVLSTDLLRAPDHHVRVLLPSECLGSACLPQDLSYRFPNEDLLDPILNDCKIQDELLQGYVTDRHLDDVVQECVRDVQQYIAAEAEGRIEELEEGSVDEEDEYSDGVEMNGHAKAPNGTLPDEDGELMME